MDLRGRVRAVGGRDQKAVSGPKAKRLIPAARAVYLAMAWLFAGCVAYQVFLAGLAVFVHPVNWGRHVQFVHVFELIPVILIAAAFAGRAPKGRGFYLRPLLLFLLIGLQYGLARSGTALAALHAVNALLIFWGAAGLAQRAGGLGKAEAEG